MYICIYIYTYMCIYIYYSSTYIYSSHSPVPNCKAQEDVCGFAWAFATQGGDAVTFDAIARYAERRWGTGFFPKKMEQFLCFFFLNITQSIRNSIRMCNHYKYYSLLPNPMATSYEDGHPGHAYLAPAQFQVCRALETGRGKSLASLTQKETQLVS